MLLMLFVLFGSGNGAPEAEPMESMAYSADSLVFMVNEENLSLTGSASLAYGSMSISADTIRWNSDEETVTALNNMILTDAGETATGSGLIYHIPTRTARTFSTSSLYDRARYNSETVTMLSRNEFNLTDVRFTSCEKDTLDYYFWSSRMKVFPDDKAVARPVILYVEETPVFWLPYAVFPIRRGRTSGFTIPTIGSTTRDGRYIRRLGYYFGFSDYADLLFSADLMEKTRFQITLTQRHVLRYVMRGGSRLQWRREFLNSRDRWLIEANHNHELPDGTTVKLTGNFVSDRSYLEESQQDPQDRMQSELRSWLSVSRNLGRGSGQATMEYTEYLDALPDTIENELLSELTAPELKFTLPSARLFPGAGSQGNSSLLSTLYWNLGSRFTSERSTWEDSSSWNAGLKLQSGLTASTRPGGILAISPSLSAAGVLYNKDRSGNTLPGWMHGSAGLTLSTDLYGIFTGRLFGYSLLRHTITPSASVRWAPDSYIDARGGFAPVEYADTVFAQFGDMGLPSSGTLFTFSLVNLLEGKKFVREAVQRRSLAELSFSTTYSPDREMRRFTNIAAGLNLTPAQWLSTRLDASYNPYERRTETVSVTTGVQLSGIDPTLRPDSGTVLSPLSWRLSVSHNWRPDLTETDTDLNKLRFQATIDITSRWNVSYSGYYDIAEQDFISHDYTIRRDLDSWEAIFTRHVSNIDTGFYFRINIKAFPDIKLEQHTSSF
jgi:hypothetical protein